MIKVLLAFLLGVVSIYTNTPFVDCNYRLRLIQHLEIEAIFFLSLGDQEVLLFNATGIYLTTL